MAEELKPCPMCGDAEPIVVGYPDAPKGKVFIGCETCGTRAMACEKEEHARRFWNRRAPSDPADEFKDGRFAPLAGRQALEQGERSDER